jgi:exodeoxyribonuclease VII small subunit
VRGCDFLSPVDRLASMQSHKAVVSLLARALECCICPPPDSSADGNIEGNVSPLNSTPAKKTDAPKKPDFEFSLTRLEEIVKKLEGSNLSLEDAMKLFEEGVQLSRDCQKYLEQAEGKVEILLKKAGTEMSADPEAEENQ